MALSQWHCRLQSNHLHYEVIKFAKRNQEMSLGAKINWPIWGNLIIWVTPCAFLSFFQVVLSFLCHPFQFFYITHFSSKKSNVEIRNRMINSKHWTPQARIGDDTFTTLIMRTNTSYSTSVSRDIIASIYINVYILWFHFCKSFHNSLDITLGNFLF